ncbi:MAG TPA: hypothetical protein ENN13_03320 [Candidatus Altiarchaeales archaeon]|nr:hypothetical protein [Candidatus Altiarchaeales archaeon]
MPEIVFGNQSVEQVCAHLKSNLRKNLRYHVKTGEGFVSIVEAHGRRFKTAPLEVAVEIAKSGLDASSRYSLKIGVFGASAQIKPVNRTRTRSSRGHDREKLSSWRKSLSGADVKKFATKKTTKPKIRSQKAGRRMVNLKGQPGC